MAAFSLSADIKVASEFAEAITQGDGSPLIWLCLSESHDTKKPPIQICDNLENAFFRLNKANNDGYGVFLTINRSATTQRTADQIDKVRAIFVDCDKPDSSSLERLSTFTLQPHLIIESSPQKYHAYWLVDGCETTQFRDTQSAFAKHFDGDPCVVDLPRVMRVPGFYHNKKEPFLSRIIDHQILRAYSFKAHIAPLPFLQSATLAEKPILKIETFAPAAGERNKEFFKLACKLQRDGVSKEEKFLLLSEKNRLLPSPLPTIELHSIIASSERYAPDTSSEDLAARFKSARPENVSAPSSSSEKKQKRPAAPRAQYFEHYSEYFGLVRKDIFTGQLHYFDKEENIFIPVRNALKRVRSHLCAISENIIAPKFEVGRVDDHLEAWSELFQPQLCLDLPTWDGHDYIRELCNRVTIDEDHGVQHEFFVQLVKDWHSRMWQKFSDPTVQNRLIVLLGGQGIGKDFWINENVSGLGQYANNLHIEQHSKDTKLQLHSGLVLKISEFDRTSRMEISTLKDLITCDYTFLRAPYAEAAQIRSVRASMISSCNLDDVLIDSTGNRRFMPFHFIEIDKSVHFSKKQKMQVLAQGKQLAAEKYSASPMAETQLRNYLEIRTPESPGEEIIFMFDELCTKRVDQYPGEMERPLRMGGGEYAGFLNNTSEASNEIFTIIRKRTGKVDRQIKAYLKSRFCRKGSGRGYFFKKIEIN